MTSRYPISRSGARGQRGNEIIEFGLWAIFIVPLFLWMFVNAMNLVRMNEATQVCRDIGNLYIHGQDFSQYPAQQLARRLANGYGLQIGSNFAPNSNATNDGNTGNGWVVLSQVTYVGASSCASLPVGTACTNQDKYVYLQRIDFGNKNLKFNGTAVKSAIGTPTATMNSSGIVAAYMTDPGAVAPNFANFVTTPLADGQVMFVAETFFASPDLNFAALPAGGIYNRIFL